MNQKCIHTALQILEELPQSYGLLHIAKQLFRAVSSIGANVAQGQDSHQGKEFVRYLNIAVRSAIESDHWLATLKTLGVPEKKISELIRDNLDVIKMLKGLRKSIEEKRTK